MLACILRPRAGPDNCRPGTARIQLNSCQRRQLSLKDSLSRSTPGGRVWRTSPRNGPPPGNQSRLGIRRKQVRAPFQKRIIMLALLGGYLNIWQLLAIVVLIVLIIVWMQVRKRG